MSKELEQKHQDIEQLCYFGMRAAFGRQHTRRLLRRRAEACIRRRLRTEREWISGDPFPTMRTEGDSQAVERFVQQHFPAFIRDNPALFSSHRDWGVIYQLEVAYKDRSSFWWCDLSMPDARLTPGKNPLANFMTGITASALLGLLAQRRGWGSVILNGSCYHFHKVYGVWKNGIVLPTHVEIFDPIELIFPSEAASEALIRNQLGEAMASDVFPVIGPAG
jgi:hypothetical protein